MADADPRRERLEERRVLLLAIEDELRGLEELIGRSALSPRVREAFLRVPRHAFVDEGRAELAYADRPLPIGHGQTISQPLMVAVMTELLELEPGDVVLEIGTGSGYQTAVLAELAGHVVSLEVVPELALRARERLAALGYGNVEVHVRDGGRGWPDRAPYDAILITAAAADVPKALTEQLRPERRLVLPLESADGGQELAVVDKEEDGSIRLRRLFPVAFVPLIGGRRQPP